jgi:Mn-dependent DtxR family transcriptional regulator
MLRIEYVVVELVDLGLATWTEKTGWRLTDAGRERSRDFLRACRSARRKSS